MLIETPPRAPQKSRRMRLPAWLPGARLLAWLVAVLVLVAIVGVIVAGEYWRGKVGL